MFKKTINVVRSWFNSAVDSVEDPAKVAQVIVQDYAKEVTNAEVAIAQYQADIKLKEIKLANTQKELSNAEQYLTLALKDKAEGKPTKESLINSFAQQVKSLRTKVKSLTESIELNQSKCASMEQRIKDMQAQRDTAVDRVSELESNQLINQSMESAAKVLGTNSNLDGQLNRLEDKVQRQTLTNESLMELRGESSSNKEMRQYIDQVENGSTADIIAEFSQKDVK